MKKKTILFSMVLLPIVALSNEPSAFGTSDFSSTTTSSQTNSYNNSISVSDRKVNQAPIKATSLESSSSSSRDITANSSSSSEQYEVMRSLLDSYASKIAKQDERMRQQEEEMKKLRDYVEESRKIQADNQEKIKAVVGELGTLIDSINKNYVPKEKFDQLANEVRGGKATKSTATSAPAETKEAATPAKTFSAKELSTKDSATLLKDADEYYDKKSYTEAQTLYKELLNRNYKPAKINYNLGEIAYSQKSYSSAIEYYKASIALFDKAAYTPTLLYHTGSSFEKLGKLKEAQGFYKALKDSYPDSPEAKKIK